MTLIELRKLFRFSFPIFQDGDRVIIQTIRCSPLTDHFKEQYIEVSTLKSPLDSYMIHNIEMDSENRVLITHLSPVTSCRESQRITLDNLLSVCSKSMKQRIRIYRYKPILNIHKQEDYMNDRCYKRYTVSDFGRMVFRDSILGPKRDYTFKDFEIIKMREIMNKSDHMMLEVVVI